MSTTIGSLVYVRADHSQNDPDRGTLWGALTLRKLVEVGNFNFFFCVVAQRVDWLLLADSGFFSAWQPWEFSRQWISPIGGAI